MSLKTLLTLSALLVAVPAIAQDQTRQQTRDPSTHADGATPAKDQTRTQTRDASHQASQDMTRERSRSMSGGGAGKGSGSGGGNGGGSGSGYRGGK